MAEVKWVKITTDMFDNRKIKHIRKLPEGNNIVLIWVMLLTMAGRCNAGGMVFLTENIPYTTKMLGDELGFEENVIIIALNALEQLGMICRDEGMLSIPGWEDHQNVEGMERIRELGAERMRRYREKKKLEITDNAMDNVTVTSRDAIDIDKDIEKDKDKNKLIAQETSALFERLWKLYPKKAGKGQVKDSWKKKLLDIGYDEMERAINRYRAGLEKDPWRQPQNGSTFFNKGYIDYLDCNSQDSIVEKKTEELDRFSVLDDGFRMELENRGVIQGESLSLGSATEEQIRRLQEAGVL